MKRKNRKMKGEIPIKNLQAGIDLTQIQLDCEPSEIEFAAAVTGGDGARLPSFKMVAYSGGELLTGQQVRLARREAGRSGVFEQ